MDEPILVIDDNPSNVKLLTFLLTSRGYEVRAASCASAAIELLESFNPVLILVDLQLPDMDGFELTRRLRADPRTREITIIALTAYAMKGDEPRAREAGCDGYITKPIDTRRFPALMAEYLSKQLPEVR